MFRDETPVAPVGKGSKPAGWKAGECPECLNSVSQGQAHTPMSKSPLHLTNVSLDWGVQRLLWGVGSGSVGGAKYWQTVPFLNLVTATEFREDTVTRNFRDFP